MMLLPNLSIKDIDRMTLKEATKRVAFISQAKADKRKTELKDFISILHLAICAGNNPTKKNNQLFYKQIDKIFNNKPDEEDNDDSLDDIMNLVNVKK